MSLADSAHKYPSMLFGGERQRVALARALAVDPSIVLMDEPFSAPDPSTRRRLRAEIESIWQRTGRTVLLSNKPTRVLESIAVTVPRPRRLEGHSELAALKDRLHHLFQPLKAQAEEL